MRKQFRHFLKTDSVERMKLAELDPVHLEMAMGDVHVNENFPIMPHVIAAMNAITYAKNPKGQMARLAKAKFLEWVHTEGLRQALLGRRQIADLASKKLGTEVPQWAVFAPSDVRKKIVGVDGTSYDEIYPEMKKLYFKKYEPKIADISTTGKPIYIPLGEINHFISNHSQNHDSFHFGGEHGLIEYLEEGDWKKDKHWETEHGRHGFDLNLPEGTTGLKQDQTNGKYYYSFGFSPESADEPQGGGFNPPRNESSWREAFRRAMSKTVVAMAKMANDMEDIGNWVQQKIADGELTPEQVQHANIGEYLGHTMGLSNKYAGPPIPFENQEDFEKVKEYTRAFLRSIWDQPRKGNGGGFLKDGKYHVIIPGYPSAKNPYLFDSGKSKDQDIEAIIDYLFDDNNMTMKSQLPRKYNDNAGKTAIRATSFLKKGSEALRNEVGDKEFQEKWATPHMSQIYNQATAALDIDEFGGTEEKISEKNLLNSKMQPMDLTDDEIKSGKINPDRDKVRFKLPGTSKVVIAKRAGDKKWSLITPPDEDVIGNDYEVTPDVTGASGTAHGGGKQIPVRKSGDQWVRRSQPKDVMDPHQIMPDTAYVKANTTGVQQARPLSPESREKIKDAWFKNPESFGDKMVSHDGSWWPASILGIRRDGRRSFVKEPGAAAEYLLRNIGNPAFKYGEPRTLGDLLKAEDTFSDQDIEKIVDGYQQTLNQGLEPESYEGELPFMPPNKFRSDVYNIMLDNGYDWRVRVASSSSSTAEREDLGKYTHELDFSTGEDQATHQVADDATSFGKGTSGAKKHVGLRDEKLGGRASYKNAIDVEVPELEGEKSQTKKWLADKKIPSQRGDIPQESSYRSAYDNMMNQLHSDEISIAKKPYAIRNNANVFQSDGDYHAALGTIDAGIDWAKKTYIAARSSFEKNHDEKSEVEMAELKGMQSVSPVEDIVAKNLNTTPLMASVLNKIGMDIKAPQQADDLFADPLAKKQQAPQQADDLFADPLAGKQKNVLNMPQKQQPVPTPSNINVASAKPQMGGAQGSNALRDRLRKRKNDVQESHFISFSQYLTQLKEGDAVYDGSKPKDGDGWNWWGAPGKTAVSIKGDADTASSDPDGTKEKNDRKSKRRKKR